MKLYTIKDELVGFQGVMEEVSDETAIRRFKSVMNSAAFEDHKSDYQLYRIGNFNEETGEITPEHDYIIGGKDV